MCHKCPPECSVCTGSSTGSRHCRQCAFYELRQNSVLKPLNTSIESVEDETVESSSVDYDENYGSEGEGCILECGRQVTI